MEPLPASAHRTVPDRRGERGFTWAEFVLVSLLVVGLIVVALLASNGIEDDTREGNCRDAKRALKTATLQYYSANDSYPINKDVLIDSGVVAADDVEGWHVEFEAGATEPTYVPSGNCT